MATVINNPPSNQAPVQQTIPANEGTGVGGMLITIAVIAVLFFLFLIYGLPAMRGGNQVNTTPTPAPSAPAERDSGSNINVDIPDEIDVNVKQ